jgi:hypothetical protein
MANTDPNEGNPFEPPETHEQQSRRVGEMIRGNVDARLSTGSTRVHLSEEQRQAMLLALAELALSRPGWDAMLREIASLMFGEQMFDELKRLNADRIRPGVRKVV